MNVKAWASISSLKPGPGALQHHNQIAIGIDHNELPEYAFGCINAVIEQPPKEAVACITL